MIHMGVAWEFHSTRTSKMEQQPPTPKPMVLEREPDDFDVACRVARRLWQLPDRALHFAASSEASKALFVAYVKEELKGIGLVAHHAPLPPTSSK